MTNTPLNFDAITNKDRDLLDDVQIEILTRLQQTIGTANRASGDDSKREVDQFVTDVTSFLTEKFGKVDFEIDDFTLWNFEIHAYTLWGVLIYAAACVPPDHPAQDVLIQILLALQSSETQWKDLPLFGIFMRDHWNLSPTFMVLDGRTLARKEWINMNAFVARVHGNVPYSLASFGVWQLREGLEDDLSTDQGGNAFPQAYIDTKVHVAAEWMIRAGGKLWKDSLLGHLAGVTETRAYIGGRLIRSINGLNLERWGFWKRRFSEVRVVVRDQAAKYAVGRALEIMTALEKKSAEAL